MHILFESIFESFPFPYCAITNGEIFAYSFGSLFKKDNFLFDEKHKDFYKSMPNGWHLCQNGYAVYSIENDTIGCKLVIFGLKINSFSTVNGKSKILSIKLDKSHIENLVNTYIQSIIKSERILSNIISSGVHEFRHINNNLYNISTEVENYLNEKIDGGYLYREYNKVKSISALSQMLKSRSDVFDVITNPKISLAKEKVHAYKAFDRARKIFISSNETNKCSFNKIKGLSDSKINAVRMFDVVPYILLHNAEKYSPKNGEIDIDFNENDNFIDINIISYGPELEKKELEKVFDFGFRGGVASKIDSKGSGIGLFVVKQIINSCDNSNLIFNQSGKVTTINGMPFKKTIVSLTVEKS